MQINAKDIIAINTSLLIKRHQKGTIVFPDKLAYLSEAPYETLFGQDNYPTIFEKAGFIYIKLIKGHIFSDGNKRTAIVTLVLFLKMNGYELRMPNDDLFKLTVDIASVDDHQIDYEAVYAILRKVIKKIS